MFTENKPLLVVGAIFTIAGSFLPWTFFHGFFGTSATRGIELLPGGLNFIHPLVDDHGGIVLVLLCLAITILTFHAPDFLPRSSLAVLICTFILVLMSIYHLASSILDQIRTFEIDDARLSVGPGVVIVFVGSILMLWSAIGDTKIQH